MQVVINWDRQAPFKAEQTKRSKIMKTRKPSFQFPLNAFVLLHTITPDFNG